MVNGGYVSQYFGEVGVSKGHEPSVLEGQHEHTLDSKGRLSVPADFRLALQLTENDELIVTRHLKERCLLVFGRRLGCAFGIKSKRPCASCNGD